MAELNSAAFIAIAGNGLSVSEDLARRFLACQLDPKCDEPEARDFPGRDIFLASIKAHRTELLAAALTIWCWGRQNQQCLKRGKPLGSFETWASWVRDPLFTLGCADPVEAMAKAKARDPRRLKIVELFIVWWENHGDRPMRVSELADAVIEIADPHGKNRQSLAVFIGHLEGTRSRICADLPETSRAMVCRKIPAATNRRLRPIDAKPSLRLCRSFSAFSVFPGRGHCPGRPRVSGVRLERFQL